MALQQTSESPGAREFVASVVVSRPRPELYAFWRDFRNAPKFMSRVESVTEVDALSWVWMVRDESGKTVQWELLVTDDEAGRMIAWATSGNTPVSYTGRIEFKDAPGSGATEIVATLRHDEHPGIVESLIEAVSGSHENPDPVVQSNGDLQRLKEFMEARPSPERA
jgi:uncharacterized membrane protein